MPRQAWAVVVIDRTIDIEGRRSVVKIFPENAADAIGKGIDAINASVPLKFEDIEILSPNDLVVTRRIDEKSDKTALYIVAPEKPSIEEAVEDFLQIDFPISTVIFLPKESFALSVHLKAS